LTLLFLLLYITLANASCTIWHNIWEVYRYDTIDEAAMILGLPNYQLIKQMNPGINIQFVSPAQQVTVPYVTPISSPGTWTTTGCSHILHLRGAPTASIPDPDKLKTMSKPMVGSVVNTLTTSNPTSESTLLPYKPPSILTQINSESPATEDTKAQSNLTETVVITSKSQSSSSITPTTSLGTSIAPTTGVKDTEAQVNPTQTKPSSTYMQSGHTLENAIPTSSAMDSLPAIKTCHAPDYMSYTHNETESLYADFFCQNIGNFWQTDPQAFIMHNYISDNGTHVYTYSVEWLPNCTRREFPPNWKSYCGQIMRQNFILCNNGGLGAFTDSNCIRYRYKPSTTFSWSIGNSATNSTVIVA
ncbi:hypothetical protein V8C42DRAFT_337106, partial [Trichoderma barbatum]